MIGSSLTVNSYFNGSRSVLSLESIFTTSKISFDEFLCFDDQNISHQKNVLKIFVRSTGSLEELDVTSPKDSTNKSDSYLIYTRFWDFLFASFEFLHK